MKSGCDDSVNPDSGDTQIRFMSNSHSDWDNSPWPGAFINNVEIDFETSEQSTPVEGKKEADVAERPAAAPTKKPEENPEARPIQIR